MGKSRQGHRICLLGDLNLFLEVKSVGLDQRGVCIHAVNQPVSRCWRVHFQRVVSCARCGHWWGKEGGHLGGDTAGWGVRWKRAGLLWSKCKVCVGKLRKMKVVVLLWTLNGNMKIWDLMVVFVLLKLVEPKKKRFFFFLNPSSAWGWNPGLYTLGRHATTEL